MLFSRRMVPPRPTSGSSWTNGVFLQDQRVVPLGPAESSFSGLLPNLSIFRSSFILRSIPIRCYPIGVLPQSVRLHKEAGCRVRTQSSLTLEAVWNSFFSNHKCMRKRACARPHALARAARVNNIWCINMPVFGGSEKSCIRNCQCHNKIWKYVKFPVKNLCV